MNRSKLVTVSLSLGCLATFAAPSEYFVRQNGGNDAYDGLAETWDGSHGPKQTIQAAVDKAAAGDTVTVFEGLYDSGETLPAVSGAGATSNRVSITKAITLRSADGAAKTIIRGAPDFTGEPVNGLGPAAVRCVYIKTAGVVLQGFTLTGGYVNQSTGSDGTTVRGGGVVVGDSSLDPKIVDCVISNNVATRGGGAFGGTLIRCTLANNRVFNTAASYKTRNGAACRTCALYGCIVARNGSPDYAGGIVEYVNNVANCTFVDNQGSGNLFASVLTTGSRARVRNCYFRQAENRIVSATAAFDLTNCATNGYPLVSTLVDDMRPVRGGDLAGKGDVSVLDDFPAGYADKDVYGDPRTTDGTVSIGAAEAAVALQGGRLELTSGGAGATIDGRPIPEGGAYVQAGAWPKQAYLTPPTVTDETRAFFGYVATNVTTGGIAYPLFNERTGGRWTMFPKQGETLQLTPKTGVLVHVRADAEAGGDGSAAKPFATLGAAASSCTGGSAAFHVIRVARGTYDTDPRTLSGAGLSRVVLNTSNILLTSEEGAAVTFIKGEQASGGGCGEGAVRCVAAGNAYMIGVSGFTLTNGYTQVGTNGSDGAGQGGAFRSTRQSVTGNDLNQAVHQVLDCVITDCAATRAPGGFGGWLQRCRISNCRDDSKANAITRECIMSSCVLHDNTDAAHMIVGQNVQVYQCTGVGIDGKANYHYGTGTRALAANTLFIHGDCKDTGNTLPICGSFADSSPWQKEPRVTYGSANLVDADGRDLRIFAGSPLVGAGSTEARCWEVYSTSDIEGRPLVFTNGKPTIGAYQHTVPTVTVSAAEGIVASPKAGQIVVDGESVEVSFASDKRHVIGLRVDGEEKPGVTSWTVQPTADGAAVTVEPIVSTDWYVNPAAAFSDENDGFTPETAKKTLCGVMSARILSGDTVHAAEGIYREEKARPDGKTVYSRVIVPEGVTLVADGARDQTVIEGEAATEPQDQGTANNTNIGSFQKCFDDYGMGEDATRCVLLMPRATLRGFTLTKAATACQNSEGTEDCLGAVVGRDYATCRVEDCLLVSNVVGRGSAAHVTLDRCVFKDNISAWNCPVARFSELHNCLATRNVGNPLCDVNRGFYNCTFFGNWSGTGRTSTKLTVCYQTKSGWGDVPCVNCIFLQDSLATANKFDVVRNCVFSKGFVLAETDSEDVTLADAAVVIDAEGRPLLDGPAVDAAKMTELPFDLATGDVLGGQRVYNDGLLDIGAVEGDWRSTYARTLSGSTRLRVAAADPSVRCSTDGKSVEIPSGELRLLWGRQDGASGAFRAKVTGGGTLQVLVNGEVVKTLKAGDPETVKLNALESDTVITLRYEPGEAENEGQASLAGFLLEGGLVMIIS